MLPFFARCLAAKPVLRSLSFPLICLGLLLQSPKNQAYARSATSAAGQGQALVARALAEMGGAARWQGVRSLALRGLGHHFLLEQSERPEGPFIPEYTRFSSLRDLSHRRQRTRTRTEGFGYTYEQVLVATDSVVAQQRGGQFFPAAPDAGEDLDLSPEQVLFTAAAAPDLRFTKDTVLQAVPHHIVCFSWRQWPVRLFLNAHTGLPTGREIIRPVRDGVFLQVWGDIRLLALYSFWHLDPAGVRYPFQTDIVEDGRLARTTLITSLVLNGAAPADSFAVPRPVQRAYQARKGPQPAALPIGGGPRPAGEIAPGIYSIPGRWDVTIVNQGDGLVILEAPISSAYSAGVLAKVRQLYPGQPIKAVISTSDAWPHLGGLREYAARHIPIYALDINQPIVEKLLRASFRTTPDSLQKAPVSKPRLNLIGAKTVLGQGTNRLEIYPARSESGERMLLVYFPAHQLLYASDLMQTDPAGGFAFAQYVAEVRSRAEALKLPVSRVFAMHSSPLSWDKVVEATAPKPLP